LLLLVPPARGRSSHFESMHVAAGNVFTRHSEQNGIGKKIQKENPLMKIVSTMAQYLAGLAFLVMGLNGFLHFIPFPPPEGVAAQFMGALFVSYYLTVIFAVQVIAGAVLLGNRFVPLALAVLAPVIFNILCFHAFMAPSGLPIAFFVTILWVLTFVSVRPAYAPLFQAQTKGARNAN
jgi:putative oxidoreductase